MTHPDLEIKRLLLSYPALYTTRFGALKSILTTTNHVWKDGKLVPYYECEYPTSMKYDDLDKREEKIKNDYSCLQEEFLMEVKKERLDRQFIEENIDLYASSFYRPFNSNGELRLFVFERIRRGWSYTKLENLPDPETVDEDWRKAIRDWMRHVSYGFNTIFMGDHKNPFGWLEKSDDPYHKSALSFRETIVKVMNWKTDEEVEKEKKTSEIANRIIDELESGEE